MGARVFLLGDLPGPASRGAVRDEEPREWYSPNGKVQIGTKVVQPPAMWRCRVRAAFNRGGCVIAHLG